MESRTDYRPRRPSTRALTARVAVLASTAALALGGLISWQMARGADPALGPKPKVGAVAAAPRRVVKTLVIRRVPDVATGSPTVPSSGSPTTSVSSPAPAPAPVSTSTS